MHLGSRIVLVRHNKSEISSILHLVVFVLMLVAVVRVTVRVRVSGDVSACVSGNGTVSVSVSVSVSVLVCYGTLKVFFISKGSTLSRILARLGTCCRSEP